MTRRKYKEPEQSTIEPIDLEWGDFSLNVTFETKQVDRRRRDKVYGREVGFMGSISHAQGGVQGDRWPFLRFSETLADVFATLSPSLDFGCWRSDRDSRIGYVRLTFPLNLAERPSMIVGEMEAWCFHGLTPEQAVNFLKLALIKSHETWKTARELEDRARQATFLRDWAAKVLQERARVVCRYEQRQAALYAEMKAEIKAQALLLRGPAEAEIRDDTWLDDTTPFHARAIEVGLDRAVKQALDRVGQRLFGSPRDINPDEVADIREEP